MTIEKTENTNEKFPLGLLTSAQCKPELKLESIENPRLEETKFGEKLALDVTAEIDRTEKTITWLANDVARNMIIDKYGTKENEWSKKFDKDPFSLVTVKMQTKGGNKDVITVEF